MSDLPTAATTEKGPIEVWIKNVQFFGDFDVPLEKNSILVIVGPNNSGKSAALRAIGRILRNEGGPPNPSSVTAIELAKCPFETLLTHLRPAVTGDSYWIYSSIQPKAAIENAWRIPWSVNALHPLVLSELTTTTRLTDSAARSHSEPALPNGVPHPVHTMFSDTVIEKRASEVFRRAFGQDLVLHRMNRASIPLLVGDRPQKAPGEDSADRSYVDRIEQLQSLETQGDGMRSFASIITRVVADDCPIISIDEPEAFLHPPQARLIAESIANFGGGRQVLVATHSQDVLKGFLSEQSSRVSVVRLWGRASERRGAYLPNHSIAELWRDPILRFSNILDSIFHDAVIVTEGDADCRFYESIANESVPAERRPDVHYVYSGGKDRIPVIAKALLGLGVPLVSIVDIDILNAETTLQRLVEAHEGDWSAFKANYLTVKKAVEGKSGYLQARDFKTAVQSELKKAKDGDAVPREVLRTIKSLTRQASPWDFVKKAGLLAIPNGPSRAAADQLFQDLRAIGIFVVPVGEMENFDTSIGSHGPRWVEEVLAKDLACPEMEPARRFTQDVFSAIHARC